jgi:hypothetical protein
LSLWHNDDIVFGPDFHSDPNPEPRTPSPETEVLAWEQIEAGRYMPRRIRGSYRGRELG